ncbi:tRNA (N6-isopentenyl adenosine(37)-C2)-methylthiotransferase MiaB [Alphaproteobacteria bacterium]|nr:tRNA (N6-isopentenyl adenosine(37)-C2)-methylthiotransferase MiaB [Alphaproteobacteria bacterium]
MKNLFVKTYGCQMNVYDSDRMKDSLAPLGYQENPDLQDADMIVLNTCHIREKASEKVFSELGRLRKVKQRAADEQNRDVKIVVAGCVAQAEGEEITRRAPWVDIVVGPQTYHRLPDLVAKLDPIERNRLIDTEFPAEVKFDFLPEQLGKRGPAAFLSVQEGCDKFCSFCVVPYTRGAEFSRTAKTIIDEAKQLISSGTRELTLLGQNVNAWHGDGIDGREWGLGRLIYQLAELPDLKRIRYTTSHPLDMDDELIRAHAEVDKLMPYLHLPIQSGSDKILHAMNRRHTSADYLKIIDRLRTAREDIAMSGDFIVGFPGETDADFADTLKLIDKVGYASAYSFKYSMRPGTPASDKTEQVPEQVKSDRLMSLQQLLDSQQFRFNKTCENTVFDVLVEQKAGRAGQLNARTPYMQSVYFEGHDSLIGKIIQVKISDARQNSLSADIIHHKEAV